MNEEMKLRSLPSEVALVVIDVQRAFDDIGWGARNNPQAEANMAAILAAWRSHGRPVIHIHHRNEAPGLRFSPDQPGCEPKPEAIPHDGEPVLRKTVNSAFIGTDLEQRLNDLGVTAVVLIGITTDHCVSTTTRMAANLGFAATVVHDATYTFDRIGPDGRAWSADEMHASALASLHQEFAVIASTSDVLASLGD